MESRGSDLVSSAKYSTPAIEGTYKKLITYDKDLRKRYTVSRLGPRTHDTEILVKVLRFWLNDHPTSAKRLELILSDEEGEKIQATVHVSVYEAYDCKVNEGDWIVIKNFDVTTQTGHCRATWHLNRIYLMPTTIITKIYFASVRHFFNFVDFEKIIDGSHCDDYLVGEVVNISESTIWKEALIEKPRSYDADSIDPSIKFQMKAPR
ncbi:unnamed protein product [Microthlaspi erraticum]|uniref:Replication protein A 70 kDa DNA-binding subunit B/D first OB fold domain-containing protein n=1 Tax=Microthlaspi erraticum TaxID=1685480 RepID=A0A6D2IU32_9BRAS|nr:unnamed protein product [Microthlaspi erraticum]